MSNIDSGRDDLLSLLNSDPALRKRLEAGDLTAWAEAFETLRNLHQGYESPGKRCRATTATPGSPLKIVILTARLESQETLWHEDDPKYRGGTSDAELNYTLNHVRKFT